MARISKEEMMKRSDAMVDILENSSDGLTVNELVDGLKGRGLVLPKNEYQAVLITLKTAAKKGFVVKQGKKWFDCAVAQEAGVPEEVRVIETDTTCSDSRVELVYETEEETTL